MYEADLQLDLHNLAALMQERMMWGVSLCGRKKKKKALFDWLVLWRWWRFFQKSIFFWEISMRAMDPSICDDEKLINARCSAVALEYENWKFSHHHHPLSLYGNGKESNTPKLGFFIQQSTACVEISRRSGKKAPKTLDENTTNSTELSRAFYVM